MSLLKCAFALLALVPLIPLWGTNHLQWHARLTYFPTEATRVGPLENVLIPKIAISDRRNVNIGGQSSNLWAVVSRNDALVSPKLENPGMRISGLFISWNVTPKTKKVFFNYCWRSASIFSKNSILARSGNNKRAKAEKKEGAFQIPNSFFISQNLKIPDDYQAVSEESQRNISQPRITHQQKQTLVNILFFSIFLSIIGALIVIAGNETGFILILLALLIAFDANGVEEAFFR